MSEQKQMPEPSISKVIENFVKSMGSLEESLLLAMREIVRAHKKAHKRLDDFAASGACKVSYQDGIRSISPKTHDYCEEFGKLTGNVDKIHIANRTVPRSFLVSLVSQYDAFLRLVFRALLLEANILRGSHKALEVADLLRFGSINDAYEWIVDREVDEVMRGSHSDQFDFMKAVFGVNWIRDEDPLWRNFIEVTERRNLFVHADGLVSNQYIEICNRNKVTLEEGVSKGTELKVPPAYFKHAYQTLLEMGIKVAQVMWRKQLPDQLGNADHSLMKTTFDLLKTGRYRLAKNLLTFATTTLKNKLHEESVRLTYKVNLAIAIKALGEKKGFAECMASEDWGASDDKSELAEAVLNERYHDALKLMRTVGTSIHKADYPELAGSRSSATLRSSRGCLQEIFGEQFDQHERPERHHSDATPESCSDDIPMDDIPMRRTRKKRNTT